MLITTDEISLETCPTLVSKNAQSCIIVIIHDSLNFANAAIGHFDINVPSYISITMEKAVSKLREADSSPESLVVELFGSIDSANPIKAETKALGLGPV